MTRKVLQGLRYKWEPQPIVEGMPMPGTTLSRGCRVNGEATVLGTSDNDQYVGVKYDYKEFVTEFTLEQFAEYARANGFSAS